MRLTYLLEGAEQSGADVTNMLHLIIGGWGGLMTYHHLILKLCGHFGSSGSIQDRVGYSKTDGLCAAILWSHLCKCDSRSPSFGFGY